MINIDEHMPYVGPISGGLPQATSSMNDMTSSFSEWQSSARSDSAAINDGTWTGASQQAASDAYSTYMDGMNEISKEILDVLGQIHGNMMAGDQLLKILSDLAKTVKECDEKIDRLNSKIKEIETKIKELEDTKEWNEETGEWERNSTTEAEVNILRAEIEQIKAEIEQIKKVKEEAERQYNYCFNNFMEILNGTKRLDRIVFKIIEYGKSINSDYDDSKSLTSPINVDTDKLLSDITDMINTTDTYINSVISNYNVLNVTEAFNKTGIIILLPDTINRSVDREQVKIKKLMQEILNYNEEIILTEEELKKIAEQIFDDVLNINGQLGSSYNSDYSHEEQEFDILAINDIPQNDFDSYMEECMSKSNATIPRDRVLAAAYALLKWNNPPIPYDSGVGGNWRDPVTGLDCSRYIRAAFEYALGIGGTVEWNGTSRRGYIDKSGYDASEIAQIAIPGDILRINQNYVPGRSDGHVALVWSVDPANGTFEVIHFGGKKISIREYSGKTDYQYIYNMDDYYGDS